MEILLANPRGFCAGVDRAIEIVERAIEYFGAPVYVRHEVVHNRFVVEGLRSRGAVFVEELDEVPNGGTVIFSAHGVSKAVEDEAARRGLRVFDATCPLVTKVHIEVVRHAERGEEVVLIGHAGHPEVEGTLGRYDRSRGGAIYLVETPADIDRLAVKDPERIAWVTQTTLSVNDARAMIEDLKRRFPKISGPGRDDICYATQNRQDAARSLAVRCGLVLVVGSRNSSNSNRLREIAASTGAEAHLIDSADDIDPAWLTGRECVGVTAGASAPEVLVGEVVAHLRRYGGKTATGLEGHEEKITFPLPKALRR